MHVIVVGAGIAGLATALSLRTRGIDVTVVEKAPALGEVGAGIQLSSNGVGVLRSLGLEERLAKVATFPAKWEYLDLDTGSMLFESPLGDTATAIYGNRFMHVHRADLLNILAAALPPENLVLGAKLVHVDQDSAGVTVKLATGDTLRADAVIAADGIHSSVRDQLKAPLETTFTGILGWRDLIPRDRLTALDLPESTYIWTGSGMCIVGYWVRSGDLFNFLALIPDAEAQRESWTQKSTVTELKRALGDCEPRLRDIVDGIDEPFMTGLFYRDPIDSWSDGRITLLGDAAHPMVPHLAQGACQSIEDAWVVAACLAKHGRGDVAAALEEYERRRLPRTTKVQSMARDQARLLQETDPEEVRARNARWKGITRIDPTRETVYGWLYRYDASRESEAPSDHALGIAPAYVGKRMERAEAQRAFDLYKTVFRPEHVVRGFPGMRDAYDDFLLSSFPVPAEWTVEEVDEDGVRGIWVTPEPPTSSELVLLHCHGGGFVMGSARGSVELAGRLARSVSARAFSLDYRRAPETPFPGALQDAVAAYRWLVGQGIPPSRIVLSGESAGGGLVMSAVFALQQAGDPLPAAVVVLSPFADQTVSGASVREFDGQDPLVDRDRLVLFTSAYFQDHEPTDPLASPLFGDFTGFPPLLVQSVRGEVLMSDSTRLCERAAQAGVDVELKLYDDSVHVFCTFPFLPETEEALGKIRSFIGSRLGST